MNPLDELKSLDRQVEQVTDLDALKPIFFRLDEIAKQHSSDFEVQLVVGDVKQHLVNRGVKLKEMAASGILPPTIRPPTNAPGPFAPPPMPPDLSSSTPTVKMTRPPVIPPAPPKSPLEGPSPLAELKPPNRMMSSGQFPQAPPPSPPKPAGGPPPLPGPAAPPKPLGGPPPMPIPMSAPLGGAPVSPGPSSTGPQSLPTATAPPPVGPPKTPAPKPTRGVEPPPKKSSSRPLIIGAMLGAIAAIVVLAFVINQARKRNHLFEKNQAEKAAVQVQIATAPPAASVRINGETKCNAPCAVPLTPGTYQVTAFLDGYEPATGSVTVTAGQPANLNLTLAAQAQTVRILTDLDQGKITIDDQPPAELQEGQFILDHIAPGSHSVKVTGKSGEASFTFDIADAKQPVITGTVTAKNLNALIVSSLGNQARVVANAGPQKLAVNGTPEEDVGPAGVDLKSFQAGVDELVIGDGKDQRNVKESFGPAPMLTAFLKSDLNIGTLIVSTGEDDVRVFVNEKEYRRKTQRGQVRIPAIGKVNVRVDKPGFQPEAAQTAEVKKGAEVRLEFKLKALPVVSTLQIRGATPGADVSIDGGSIGTVNGDGTFTNLNVLPGDHVIELRLDKYQPKRLQRSFRAGQATTIAGADAALVAALTNGTIRVARTPANAAVSYRRDGENDVHELRAPQVELPAGNYIFSARAAGYTDKIERVSVGAGESKTLELALVARPTAPVLKGGDITDFEDAVAWTKNGELWTHKGGGVIPYKLGPKGTYTFTVELVKGGGLFRGGRIRWVLQYVDSKNYLMYELDRHTFWAEVIEKGKKFERQKTPLPFDTAKSFTIQIEVTGEHAVHKVKQPDGNWLTLDTFAEPGRNFSAGKFGFLIQGSDEIGISDFSFTPK